MVNAKALAAARRRRKARERPLPMDNHWLRAAGERRNHRTKRRASVPAGGLCRRVLDLLRSRPMSVPELRKRTGESQRAIRSAIDSLRIKHAYSIVNVTGRFLLGKRW